MLSDRKKESRFFWFLMLLIGMTYGCGGSNNAASSSSSSSSLAENTSISGSVASAVGGALSGSSASGTQASVLKAKNKVFAFVKTLWGEIPEAIASNAVCPTYKTTTLDCVASGSTLWLTYNNCSFKVSTAIWNAVQAYIAPSGTATCGTFPITSSTSGIMVRQFVQAASSTAPANDATIVNAKGVTVTYDHATANLNNFNGDTIATTHYANNGYGVAVTFVDGLKTALSMAQNLVGNSGSTELYNHTITTNNTPLSISESTDGTSRTINGTITVYHNLMKVIATATLSNVIHQNDCCYPVSGTITATFAAGSASGTLGQKAQQYVQNGETLTLTGCGTATLVDFTKTTTSLILNHCQ